MFLNQLRNSWILALVGWICAFRPTYAQLEDPIPEKIQKGTIAIELQPIAQGLTAPVFLSQVNDGSSRLFITDQAGTIRIVQNGMLLDSPFLDVHSRLVDLGFFGSKDENDFDERGLLGLAFHPDFANTGSPGFGKVYTYSSEPVSGPADFTVALPAGTEFNHQSVVAEWQVSSSNPNQIDPATRRELMRVDEPQFNHNAGMVAFGPDNNLYIAFGDGGAANDNAAGHGTIGNGQDRTNILGTIVRVDVNGNNSANGQYGIPPDNPFVGDPAALDEIYAYGFRNPFRFSFDTANDQLIVADVGQGKIEEIDIVEMGKNYGWRLKEGSFAFDFLTGEVSDDLSGLPEGLVDPVAEYDHDEGLSIIGGFMYHGSGIPELQGKYVFGDFSTEFRIPLGRLFYADLDTGLINEFRLGVTDRALGMFVKGFGQDLDGEIYLLAGPNLGPFGSSGQVLKLVVVPEPAGVLAGLLGLVLLSALARRTCRMSCKTAMGVAKY